MTIILILVAGFCVLGAGKVVGRSICMVLGGSLSSKRLGESSSLLELRMQIQAKFTKCLIQQ